MRISFASCFFFPGDQCLLSCIPTLQTSKLTYGEWSELPQVTEPGRGLNGPRPTQSLKCHVGSRWASKGLPMADHP